MTQTTKKPKAVALISTPWPLYNRPSIQLGALKAYLQLEHPEVRVDARHFYLKLAESIGYKRYQMISERTWLAESIYAALLFPERFKVIERLFDREVRLKPELKEDGLEKIVTLAKKATDAFISSLRGEDYMLAGFSVSLCQLTSTLYFIKRIKQKFPDLIIVIGGSTFSGTAAGKLFEFFPEVDFVVNGEGELPLSQLVGCLKASSDPGNLPSLKGVITPTSSGNGDGRDNFNQLNSLNKLPPPNYDDYFALLKSFRQANVFFPVLPVETSRGCWWQKTMAPGRTTSDNPKRSAGCAFCNLNLQWRGYRHKDPARVVNEIDHLTGKFQTLAVSIVDNVLPRKSARELFKKVSNLKKDLHFFAEIRADTPASELEVMRDAGMQELQIGIEALSTSLLLKLHKGTSAIQNLEVMRNCEALGIANRSNLILHFPGSDEQDVAETLRNLDFALPFRPLQTVNFWLGLGSPVWQNPTAYGIKAVFNHPNWSRLFPPGISRSMAFMIQAYRGDLGFQQKIWQPVKEKVTSWQKTYTGLQHGPLYSPILSLRDGREFLIIKQRQYQADSIKHRLVGTSRLIYLFCMQRRSLTHIRSQFPSFAEDKIVAFLKMMVDKKLMFEEKENYLSLAAPKKPGK
ncbi:MAG: RiPP maturation radical SAM C-methyltransferase [Desulfobacterales bacterium]|nr:MAG: RiPP maturation radical SAM C-methyltransferase [Desulfobacterales bacterium]